MLTLTFAGRYQCRLATDPDAYDDPRGQQGWTFAMPGEPDLDRLIRFQNAVAPRSHAPAVGVTVRGVSVNGHDAPGHPLLAATVDLLDGALYEGRNGEIATSAQEPIIPFHIRIAGNGVTLTGRDPIDLNDPDEIIRRQPTDFNAQSAAARQAAGIGDPRAWRQARRTALQADLANTADPVQRQALERRIQQLPNGAPGDIRLNSLSFQLSYSFALRGPNDLDDPGAVLNPAPAAGVPWQVDFWMGAWDADALCGYTSGTLTLP